MFQLYAVVVFVVLMSTSVLKLIEVMLFKVFLQPLLPKAAVGGSLGLSEDKVIVPRTNLSHNLNHNFDRVFFDTRR